MAVYISDSIYGAVPLPLDAKTSNIVPQGAYTRIEGISEYLARVDLFSRYLGMIVSISHPEGYYENSDYLQKIASGEISITHYAFMSGIEDEDFLPWCPDCSPPIIQTRWVVVSSSCVLDEERRRTGMVDTLEREEKKVDDGPWIATGQTKIVSSFNPTLCPLPPSREVETDRECILVEEQNNGYLKIIYNIEQQTVDGNWIVVEENKERIVYDAVACPLPRVPVPQYRLVYGNWMCTPVGDYTTGYKSRTVTREVSLDEGNTWTFESTLPNENIYDISFCPLPPAPQYRFVYGDWNCIPDGNYSTGYKTRTVKREISVDGGETWTFESNYPDESVYDTSMCPLPPAPQYRLVYGSWSCIPNGDYSTGYKTRTVIREVSLNSGLTWVFESSLPNETVYDATACPLPPPPQYRFIYGDWNCIPDGNYNTGYKTRTVVREVSMDAGETWVFESNYPNEVIYDTTFCPLTPYGLWVSVDFSSYDYSQEVKIPFTFGQEKTFASPTKDDYVYLFLSIPAGRTFYLKNAMGIIILDNTASIIGPDNRSGYRNNNIYSTESVFDGLDPIYFTIKID